MLAPLEEAATALEEVVRNISQEEELGRYVTLNDAFHDGLVELARSPNLARTLANVKALPSGARLGRPEQTLAARAASSCALVGCPRWTTTTIARSTSRRSLAVRPEIR